MPRHYNGLASSDCIFMRRALMGGTLLLLGGAIVARGKTEALLFVFLRVDHEQDVAILRPMIAPDIGVQLDSGPRQLAPGIVLTSVMLAREHAAIAEVQCVTSIDIVLN